jgi:hypothetical protein
MKTAHHCKFKYWKKLNEDTCKCQASRKHCHRWKLVKQTTPFPFTNHNFYECECGKEKEDYDYPGGKYTIKNGIIHDIIRK